jgi:hypothetical protein
VPFNAVVLYQTQSKEMTSKYGSLVGKLLEQFVTLKEHISKFCIEKASFVSYLLGL